MSVQASHPCAICGLAGAQCIGVLETPIGDDGLSIEIITAWRCHRCQQCFREREVIRVRGPGDDGEEARPTP